MTRERIEDIREVVLPFVKKKLLEINYENLGELDAEMFAKDFDEILNLAIKALEQEPVLDRIKENIQFIKDKCLPNNIAEEYEQKGLQEALDIIDKYKVEIKQPESEDNNADKEM